MNVSFHSYYNLNVECEMCSTGTTCEKNFQVCSVVKMGVSVTEEGIDFGSNYESICEHENSRVEKCLQKMIQSRSAETIIPNIGL